MKSSLWALSAIILMYAAGCREIEDGECSRERKSTAAPKCQRQKTNHDDYQLEEPIITSHKEHDQ